MVSKKNLRTEYKVILNNLDSRWVSAASHRLCRNLDSLFLDPKLSNIQNILCFSAFFGGEVDLTSFIANQIDQRKVFLPRTSTDGTMVFLSIGRDWQSSTQSGVFGIPEPSMTGGEVFTPDGSDSTAILVPGLVFDSQGNRLGRGKGYYDRFLQIQNNYNLISIGICWDMQIQLLNEIPTEEHDVMMNFVVTEERTLAIN
jgi:5-formyltetrahydrofolate cyclo-ligase